MPSPCPRILAPLLACVVLPVLGCPERSYPQAPSVVIRVDPGQRFQTIEGIGGSAANEASLRGMPEPDRSEVMDLVFGDLAPSVVRVKPRPLIEPANDDDDPSHKNAAGFVRPDDHLWQLDQITSRGDPLLVGALWTPPAWMKDTGRENGGGSLIPGMEPELAEFFSVYLDFVADAGHRLDALSIQNEPESAAPWDSNVYSPVDYGPTLELVIQRLVADGHEIGLVAPDNAVLNFTLLYHQFLENQPTVMQHLSALAFHLYQFGFYEFDRHASAVDDLVAGAPENLPLWMTEYSNTTGVGYGSWEEGLAQAKLVHIALVRGISTYVMWNLYRPGGPGEALIVIPTQAGEPGYTITPKYWTLRQFTRHVRPGAERIAAESDDAEVLASAYRDDAAGRTVAVLINEAAEPRWAVVLGGALNTRPAVVRSSATENGVQLGPDTQEIFSSRAVYLPASSVTTVIWPDA